MIDNAAAVAARRRTVAAPAQVVERTALDAQQRCCLVDGEKGRVVILGHEDLPRGSDFASLSDPCALGRHNSQTPEFVHPLSGGGRDSRRCRAPGRAGGRGADAA
jgi:hypothetical protein